MDRKIEKPRGYWLRKHWPWLAGAAVMVAMLLWLAVGNHSATLRVAEDEVTVSTVSRGEFKDYVRTSGQVMPIQVVQIAPEEGGIVMEKVVEEGASVHRGDVIVRLANANLDLQILNAEAELAEKQNMLRNTQVAMEQDRLSNMTEEAQLVMDTERKRRTKEQNERLYGERLISKEQYVQSREDWELAERKKSLVKSRLRQDSIYRSVQMDQMEDNLAAMRRNVVLVRQRKEKLEVRATIDGELGLLDVELGQSIQPGMKIGQINDLRDFKVQALVDEHYIERLRQGLRATTEREGQRYTLRVRKVYPEVREGKFRVDFVFEPVGKPTGTVADAKATGTVASGRPEQLRSGQTLYLNVELGQSEEAVLIPRGTFFQTTGGQWIFVLDKSGSKAYRRNIRIGRQNPQYYEVLEGLEPGERVITSGYEAYKDYEVLEMK
ncbi:MAG: HlyD family efflux transporter periplasmic adaptor subunit [Bacteroidaceae bacterium]|nr:HlyD family efflux transporter periplasmic adaptor subunit [Bacteroidaceae bacterium]